MLSCLHAVFHHMPKRSLIYLLLPIYCDFDILLKYFNVLNLFRSPIYFYLEEHILASCLNTCIITAR